MLWSIGVGQLNIIIIELILDALMKYREINNVLPQYIIVYRDGVGDGQLSSVVKDETKQICDGFKKIGDAYR